MSFDDSSLYYIDKDALFAAIASHDVKAFHTLIKHPGFSVTENNFWKSTVEDLPPFEWSYIHAAAYHNRPKMLQTILEADADIELRDQEHGGTALGWAAYAGHVETVRLLLEKGADKTATNKDGKAPADLLPNPTHEDWVNLLTEVRPLRVSV